ncbi:MAG: response regulator [Nitrospirae bacterium]|nr:response regulator [Nitrospirota bacterium]
MNSFNFLRHYRESFGDKTFYLFTLFIIAISVTFIGFFINHQNRMLKNNLIHDGKQLAGFLSYTSKLAVFAENRDLLVDMVEGVMQNKEVVLVQIFNAGGKELIARQRKHDKIIENPEKMDPARQTKEIETLRISVSPLYSENDNEIEFLAPVILKEHLIVEETMLSGENSSRGKDNFIGFVRIVFNKEPLHKSLSVILLNNILILVSFIIFSSFIIYYLVRQKITKPLNSLAESAQALGEGDFFRKVPVDSTDEIGRLAKTFNDMAESLGRRESEKQYLLTEQRRLEEQLRHAQKMEAIGQLAGGVAHDFNNILTAVMGYGHLLQMKLKGDDPLKHNVDQILTVTKRGADLTRNLLAFSRKQAIELKPVNINKIIETSVKLLPGLIGERIELKTILADENLTMLADSFQIEQVILNLASNARDAMPEGGALTIATESMEMDRKYISVHGYGNPGAYVLLSFTDTGTGMDEETKKKIFDPFFTTKKAGEGTGLGLAMIYGILKQHNGYITVDSEEGKGTTFRIYFPLVDGKEEDEVAEASAPAGGKETILIAEDDAAVREPLKAALEIFGYDVIETVDGEDAVAKFKENKERIKLLLFDVIMPKMNGKEAYEEIKLIRPEIKVIFTSGYTANTFQAKEIVKKELTFISKPVSPNNLLRKIREVLDK